MAARFDYPDILRSPTPEVLDRFRSGGTPLVLLWWAFALSAVLLVPLAVLLTQVIDGANDTVLLTGGTIGVLAATVQFLGLMRWPFLVPYLARIDAESTRSSARTEAIDVIFQSFNRYLGVAVGEHLGYALTGAWTILTGAALWQSSAAPDWLGILGLIIGTLLVLCSLEFVGPSEPTGWKLAATLTPIIYIAWSVWLIAIGIAFLI